MSLLGPDDFDLSKKERRKKLAKDLSPAVRREVNRILEQEDKDEAIRRIEKIVGREKARQLLNLREKEKER